MAAKVLQSGGRYPVLRSVAILFMIGSIFIIGSAVYGIVLLMGTPTLALSDRIEWSIVTAVGAFFGVLIAIGAAEMIKLFMDIERNTRASAQSAASANGKSWLDAEEETAEGALIRGH